MTGTSAFDAKQALYTLFCTEQGGDGEFTNTEIWYGFKGRSSELPREVIWIGEIEWDSEQPSALGALRRVEEYRIMIGVEVHKPGDDQKEVNDRLEVLVQKIEDLLRAPNPLSLTGIEHCGIVPMMLAEGQDADGRGAIFLAAVRIRHRK